jgi:hypothetical protein
MSTIRKNARLLMLAFGVAVALPTILSITASVGEASGYMVASGIYKPDCTLDGPSDCPDGDLG